MSAGKPVPTPPPPTPAPYEYCVMEIGAAPGQQELQTTLNDLAAQGWRLVAVIQAPSLGVSVVLERSRS